MYLKQQSVVHINNAGKLATCDISLTACPTLYIYFYIFSATGDSISLQRKYVFKALVIYRESSGTINVMKVKLERETRGSICLEWLISY